MGQDSFEIGQIIPLGCTPYHNDIILNMTPHGKLETLETVWLFEFGEFYEAPHLKKIYVSKDVALLKVPDNFIFVEYSTSKNLYYESDDHWIKISEIVVEKE